MQEKEEDLENTKEIVDEFEERLSTEVRKQKGIEERWNVKLNPRVDEFKRIELPGKYMVKLLYGWDDKRFEEKYLRKLERNWNRQKKGEEVDEKKYVKKLEESLEWNKMDKKMSRIIWENNKKVSPEEKS